MVCVVGVTGVTGVTGVAGAIGVTGPLRGELFCLFKYLWEACAFGFVVGFGVFAVVCFGWEWWEWFDWFALADADCLVDDAS